MKVIKELYFVLGTPPESGFEGLTKPEGGYVFAFSSEENAIKYALGKGLSPLDFIVDRFSGVRLMEEVEMMKMGLLDVPVVGLLFDYCPGSEKNIELVRLDEIRWLVV